jgi:hypothetical protein
MRIHTKFSISLTYYHQYFSVHFRSQFAINVNARIRDNLLIIAIRVKLKLKKFVLFCLLVFKMHMISYFETYIFNRHSNYKKYKDSSNL